MNQLISKSTSEDINTNLAISDTIRCERTAPPPLFESNRGDKEKRSRTCGRLPFHKQRYRGQTFSDRQVARLGIVLQSGGLCSSTVVCNIG